MRERAGNSGILGLPPPPGEQADAQLLRSYLAAQSETGTRVRAGSGSAQNMKDGAPQGVGHRLRRQRGYQASPLPVLQAGVTIFVTSPERLTSRGYCGEWVPRVGARSSHQG